MPHKRIDMIKSKNTHLPELDPVEIHTCPTGQKHPAINISTLSGTNVKDFLSLVTLSSLFFF